MLDMITDTSIFLFKMTNYDKKITQGFSSVGRRDCLAREKIWPLALKG